MSKIVLSTESVADLPKDLIEKYQIQIIPMHVIMDGKDYLESELSVEEVYDYYNRTKKIPSTTSTNAHEYHSVAGIGTHKLQIDLSCDCNYENYAFLHISNSW